MYVIVKWILVIDGWGISCEIALNVTGLHWWSAVQHKYSHPVAKCDLWITWATQNAAMDGPVGD